MIDDTNPPSPKQPSDRSTKEPDVAGKWQRHAERTAADSASNAEATPTDAELEHISHDDQPSIEFPKRDALEDELTVTELKLHEMTLALERAQEEATRAQAEVQNIRKRMERRVQETHQFALEKFVKDLLPVIDAFRRCLDNELPDDQAARGMYDGIQLTYEMLLTTLEKQGVTPIAPQVGEPFDPAQHEAMTMAAETGATPHTILAVLEPGYALNGRILRAAMVSVAK